MATARSRALGVVRVIGAIGGSFLGESLRCQRLLRFTACASRSPVGLFHWVSADDLDADGVIGMFAGHFTWAQGNSLAVTGPEPPRDRPTAACSDH